MALGGATASALSGYMQYNMTIGGSTVTIDLGFIPGLGLAFGGLALFFKGLRKAGVSL
ncbi:hypothetical protein [Pyrodictium delaneyi]|nr:hypothetical protein [Pyrodictium delaneyi]